jgi:hypothetical protein
MIIRVADRSAISPPEKKAMSNATEATTQPKSRSWMFLVAGLVALCVIGALTS